MWVIRATNQLDGGVGAFLGPAGCNESCVRTEERTLARNVVTLSVFVDYDCAGSGLVWPGGWWGI